ncbi:MAG: excinuclease ABC subunit UvrC [Oscillospiraceae bacterium]
MLNNIKEKLKNLPLCPGIYIMKDENDNIIYIGKSKLLKNRVSSYFINSKNHTAKTVSMVSQVRDFDYIMTDTEVEALILECNLIKKHRPKYNILLKDDKQYPYIKITINDEYPRIYVTRTVVKDGSKYYGPYMSAKNIRDTIDTIKKIFKVRSCNKRLPQDIGKGRPCLYYHLNQCSAPCANKISETEYKEIFDKISLVLDGKYSDIIVELKKQMNLASENLEFERAARYRDKIEHLKILGEKQKIISTDENNRDIIGVFNDDVNNICVQVFYMRDGKIIGSEHFVFEDTHDNISDIISSFVKQYYFTATNIPREILLPAEIEDKDEIEEWLKTKTGYKIELKVPMRGEKLKIVKMVNKNAEESLKLYLFKRNKESMEENQILLDLTNILKLPKTPFRIESYDISNISGAQSVGVCIVYKDAKESKKDYRKFNIKTVEGANDYESMREVIYRRINQSYKEEDAIKSGELLPEKAKFLPLPDLILLDGGKGHVSVIKELFDTMGEEIPVFGLVKDDKHRTRGLTDENNEISLDNNKNLFNFLTCMQDEVHRFAITTFRKKHENITIKSELENIKGIGESKRKKLLLTFMNIERIKNATISELFEVVDKKTAESVYNYYHNNEYKNGGNLSD